MQAAIRDWFSKLLAKFSRPWTDFRAISNSHAARSTILILLIGYLVLFNENVVKYLHLPKELGGSTPVAGSGISMRLLLVYFGLCFVAAGTALYGFFCPPEVKQYGSANGYVAGDGDSIKSMVLDAIQARLARSDFGPRYENALQAIGRKVK
jgi:hypothetical protein